MSKIIYLDSVIAKEQNHINYTDEFTKLLINYLNSINKKFIIYLINYLFNKTISITNTLNFDLNNRLTNSTDINLHQNNLSIDFSIKKEPNIKYSLQVQKDLLEPFTITLLRYLKTENKNSNKDIIVNIPDARIVKFNNIKLTSDFYNYVIQMFNHTFTYKLPIFKCYEKDINYIKENSLFILIPFSIFFLQEDMMKLRKTNIEKSNLKEKILKITIDNSTYFNELYEQKIITTKDYNVFISFISELSTYLQDRFV